MKVTRKSGTGKNRVAGSTPVRGICGEAEEHVRMMELARRLILEHRSTCLWFLRDDYMPVETGELVRIMNYIILHGALTSYQEARRVKAWLSR